MRRLALHHAPGAGAVALLAMFLGFLGAFGWLELKVTAEPLLNVAVADAQGDLSEIKDSRRIALLVIRSSVVDASGSDEHIVTEALAAQPKEGRRHRYAYGTVARKLNEYLRKYRSLRPVDEIAQADFIIYFKLVEYRRQLNGIYPFGELFVIINPRPEEGRPARVIWKTKKIMYAEDAVKDFVKQLKRVRQER